ncbi:hypothetical protein BGX26_004131 [Mortierella sp. AD094]|nr:hypothetical protein BGX26_004131 [Mortierella sp. AD094]
MLCCDSTTVEIKAACLPDLWETEEYGYDDQWVYSRAIYLYPPVRHNYSLARLLPLQEQYIEAILAMFGHFPESVYAGKRSDELLGVYRFNYKREHSRRRVHQLNRASM